MPHLFIAYDNRDKNQGDYFENSHQHLVDNVKSLCKIQQFDTDAIAANTLPTAISALNNEKNTPFIFVNYTHGSNDALHIDNANFIDKTNAHLFGETLFYACSCLAGKDLKNYLMHHNCKFFMGYNKEIGTLFPETEAVFYHCENSVMIHFLTTNHSIQDCITYMYDTYESLKLDTDSSTAARLDANLDAFVYEGNTSLTKHDFITTFAEKN